MKNVLVLITLIWLGGSPSFAQTAERDAGQAEPKIFLSVINDNNTGNVERGEAGQYIGPDDFLTVSAFLRVHYQEWRGSIVANVLTSRKFKYRYDLVYAGVSKKYALNTIEIQPELGIVWKGNIGGEKIQNGFHRMKDLPELFIPYRQGGTGIFAATMASMSYDTQLPWPGIITASAELRLLSDYVPSRFTPMLGYQVDFWNERIQIELLGGGRFYLNEIEDYSQLIRSGPFVGGNIKTRVYQNFYFDAGLALFPAQNLENDPVYKDKAHDYVPQILMVFSWNSAGYRFYNFLEY